MKQNNIILAVSSAAVFSLLYITGIFNSIEDRLYDFFLRFRVNRPRIENVTFLDIDDSAIFYNGVYPWPRSIPADGLLRLREYGALAAIFDIEYIDHGPQGVDSLYLNQGLESDFNRSLQEVNSSALDLFASIIAGRIGRSDIDKYAGSFITDLNSEYGKLYSKAQNIARDNDRYLAQALELFGNSWSTLNLREFPLDGEQAERRPIAEEHFSYPIKADKDANKGGEFVDILPALPVFAKAVKGAGFTNVEIDNDGVRRRIYLAQKIFDHWYLQLSFAPLMNYLGNPEIELKRDKLIIKQVMLPNGVKKDIVIPLDKKGRMLLDWPKEDYNDSYKHISFTQFSLLDKIEAELEYYGRALAAVDLMDFIQLDASLYSAYGIQRNIEDYFDAAHEVKGYAVENLSDDYFQNYLDYRDKAFTQINGLIAVNIDEKVSEITKQYALYYPNNKEVEVMKDSALYISQLINNLKVNLERRAEISNASEILLRDKFVIIGRVDTGTTDYGANPFYGRYNNVGTHAVALDTILSESFIIPLGIWWRITFLFILVILFFILSDKFAPVLRAVSGFILALLILTGAILLFRLTGFYWGPLGTVLAVIIATIAREIISYAGSEKEKQFLRTAFSTYVSDDVVKEIISDPSRLQLGGTERYMTAIFTDIRGFSTISEQLDPEELVSLLNRYLSAMSDIILSEKGTIDKYEGDAIIAFFGAPLELPDHALRACISAVNIKKAEIELNKVIIEQKLSSSPLITRIGINTGSMVAGNMGTTNKMNYTIMGNSVNLAARLEGVNKQYGTWILTSEDTIRETGERLLHRKLDRVRVVGINEPVRLCEIVDVSEQASDEQKKLVNIFHNALGLFEERNWKLAAEGFKEAMSIKSDDAPSRLYLERCEQFIKKPPEKNWDGVYNLSSK